MRAVDLITKKRGNLLNPKGEELSREELSFLINGYVNGNIPDYQIASWLMSVYFNGMTFQETGILTDIMLHSGLTFDLSGINGPFVDKHSTGGVGDKISLPLAPLAAACGVKVPMMSGRALGHTGGTLDKLESIKGFNVSLNQNEFKKILSECGFAMTGQTKEIVPADRLLYALRDVTGTVESIPLITASILSKKVAEGSDAFVLDVKYGSGAFMKTEEAAEQLAVSMVNTLKTMNKKATAILTNMNTPLGYKIGNFLEIEETVECLEGKGPKDVMELTNTFCAWMCVLGGKAKTLDEGFELCKKALESGKALELFYKNVDAQGGNAEQLQKELGKRRSKYKTEIFAEQDGYLYVEAYKTGIAGCSLGVGRNKTDESVCADAGMILHKISGDKVKKGDLIMEVFGKSDESLKTAEPILKSALTYSQQPDERMKKKLILKTIES
ncbi:MAG: thymidine phosphorylase [Treponemataceae bacterium]|nr:thymidine phosphorylase [Treponemataceae bacterium]